MIRKLLFFCNFFFFGKVKKKNGKHKELKTGYIRVYLFYFVAYQKLCNFKINNETWV